MSEIKLKHWTGKQLIYFGEFIWSEKNWGWAMLIIHSTIWGMKMHDMLKLRWRVLLNEDYTLRKNLDYSKLKETRGIDNNELIQSSIRRVLDLGVSINLDKPIYVNSKGRPLTTSTLNRELNGFVKEFRNKIDKSTRLTWNLKSIKTNTFQIAWALDVLNMYDFQQRAFGAVSRYMNHKCIADTIELLEVEPMDDDEIWLNFNDHSYRKALDFEKMDSKEISNEFYSIPLSGRSQWEDEHVADHPI